jgi:hypothetical protein
MCEACGLFMYEDSNSLPSPVMSVGDSTSNNISFHTGTSEMLKVSEDGFYVRGQKLPVDEAEALAVYKAFKDFLIYHGLTREY